MPLMNTGYGSPFRAVFLRALAWEIYVAAEQPRVVDLENGLLPQTRRELGMEPQQGGYARDFLQNLRKDGLLSAPKTPPEPLEKVWKNRGGWRLLEAPPHDLVRKLSARPVVTDEQAPTSGRPYHELLVTLRDPAVPKLRVSVGDLDSLKLPPRAWESEWGNRRGVYFFRKPNSLYIGQTDEFKVRMNSHENTHKKKKQPFDVSWWVFVSQEESGNNFTQDSLNVAESLLICFWDEVADVENNNKGRDEKPALQYFQQGVLLAEAAAAILIWLTRDVAADSSDWSIMPNWSIPFKTWSSPYWPHCYTRTPDF